MPRLLAPRSLAALAAVAALALGACGQDEDVTRERFESDLIDRTSDGDDPTISDAAAACITDAVFEDYEQAEINRIYRAATEDELTNERRDELVEINQRCLEEHPLEGADAEADASDASDGDDGGR